MASTRERRTDAGAHMAVLIARDQPRAKRTSDEVAAADAERAANAEALARQREEALALIARIDASFDAAQAAEEADSIDDLADLPANAMEDTVPQPHGSDDEPIMEITQEDFDRIEDDNAYLSDSEWEEPKKGKGKAIAAPAPSKQRKKLDKYETRRSIEALGQELKKSKAASAETGVVKRKGVQNSDAAAASTSAGLAKGWGTKTSASPDIGGFTDEDAGATRPDFEGIETVRAPRKNTMVGLVSVSDEDEIPSQISTVSRLPRKPRAPVKMEADTKIPALAVRARKPPKAIAKTESSSSSYTPTPFTPQSSADVNGLPAFITKTWKSKFLVKCYWLLYTSDEPMMLGAVGDDHEDPGRPTVDLLQSALDELYPEVSWKLEWDDVICSRAVSRIREERAKFGKRGARYADDHFNDKKYYKGEHLRLSTLIASDTKYALRKNGPAFYKDPTPRAVCRLQPDNPAYIKPRGYLESAAVIHTVSPVIGAGDWTLRVYKDEHNREKVDLSGLPVGALALAVTGVERGFKLHTTGVRTKPLEFSAANIGPVVAEYVESIKGLRASHWQSIITACGAAPVVADAEEEDSEIEDESLDGARGRMYIPSSSPCHE
ncbi:hypothetical protein B0H16DRAFT_1695021 [Mycena metata]|uniref:Uncharacterized protein n=1 Tax=Mycena metata TaxID=1033252 RepID=A0AAD7I8Y2_9AGAR|nr:hypothetical protein B0H16DRAFT_1695021 [Mycena metata]